MSNVDGFVAYPFSTRFTLAACGGRRARRIRVLAGTSDWRRGALELVGAAAVTAVGTRPWPRATAWAWPRCDPVGLTDMLRAFLPGLVIIAAAAPRQPERARLSVLGRWRDCDIVIKLGPPDDGLEVETLVLELLALDPLPGIATPPVVAAGQLMLDEPIAFLATDGLELRRQRPAIDEPLRTFEADLAERLQSLPRPQDSPDDATPTHGDLAPWNLRRTGRGLALFDWEEAGWRKAGYDLAHYRRASAELRAPRRRMGS